MYLHQELTQMIISAAIEVHKNLGPGLLENVYKLCLCTELENLKLSYQTEVDVPIIYKNKKMNNSFRLDFLIEGEIILELKAVEVLLPVHEAQLRTYLRMARKELGLLFNYNVPVLKDGIRRCILTNNSHSLAGDKIK